MQCIIYRNKLNSAQERQLSTIYNVLYRFSENWNDYYQELKNKYVRSM